MLNACRRHGRFHKTRIVKPKESKSAQRLSASWTISRWRCLYRQYGTGWVLNACRRHGRFHLSPVNDSAKSSGAQRLSASWTISPLEAFVGVFRQLLQSALTPARHRGLAFTHTGVEGSTLSYWWCSAPVSVMDDSAWSEPCVLNAVVLDGVLAFVMDDFTRLLRFNGNPA